jgi:nicotinate-nucleotide pyrophosphorylase (carboxylating)
MTFDCAKNLRPLKSAYKKQLEQYIWKAYLNDTAKGDVTTGLLKNKARRVHAEILVKQPGILAGIDEAEWLLKKVKLPYRVIKKDGARVNKGDKILRLVGHADRILAVERTLLNLLQHMSGIATITGKMKSKLPKSIKLLATRKTLWGDLDKRAVSLGGGLTHRLNLGDAVLIKDNHWALAENIKPVLVRAFRNIYKTKFVEIEAESIAQAEQVLRVFESAKKLHRRLKGKFAVMLDNFRPKDIKRIAPGLKQAGILVEVSGGINEKNIKKFALRGVSAISAGLITSDAPKMDMSLTIIP